MIHKQDPDVHMVGCILFIVISLRRELRDVYCT